MTLLDLFRLSAEEQSLLLHGHHNYWLMLLSLVVAVLASGFALQVSSLVRVAETRLTRHIALLSGSLTLGGGIWAMHFIGMLAFSLDTAVSYDPQITLLSVVPAMLASWVALELLAKQQIRLSQILLGGLLVGAGIGSMHYTGMAAMRMNAELKLDPIWFGASLLVAVTLSMLALWVRFGLRRVVGIGSSSTIVLGGIIMGMAIAAMHYTGMAAARFVGHADGHDLMMIANNTPMALSIALITLGLGLAVAVTNGILRYRYLLNKMRASETHLRAVVDTAVDGIITLNARGIIESFNRSAEQLFGWRAEEVIGQNIKMLMPDPFRSEHDQYLSNYFTSGKAKIIGSGREVIGQRKDGSQVPIRLAIGEANINNQPLFVGFVSDITRRKAIEQSLRQSEQQYSSLIANIPGVSFRCLPRLDWRMLFISDAVQELTGWPASAFMQEGKSFGDLLYPEEARPVFEEVMSRIERREKYAVEYRIIRRDGSERWVSESASAIYNEQGEAEWIDGVMIDITASKLRNAEFESTVHGISRAQAVIEFDMDGQVLALNENAQNLIGYTQEQLADAGYRQLFARDKHIESVWPLLRNGQFQSGEFRINTLEERECWIQGHFNPILAADGKPGKVVLLASDLTERRRMVLDLRLAKERAEQAADAKSAFLANMSHEIRTPMNAIIGFSELLLESPLEAQQYRHLKTVHSSARSLLRLLNDILDTAKLERGAIELEQQDFSLLALCSELADMFSLQAASKGLNLVLDYQASGNWYRGDPLRIRQVLVNLLGNAVKFTEQGEVRLQVSDADGQLSIRVIDTGIGIAAGRLERIFEPFAQADASMSRRFGGTGLGTTIARQLTALMQGTLTVNSTPGQGSVFELRLSLPASREQVPVELVQVKQLPALHILAADDVEENLELLKLVLGRAGHQVDVADNGQQAYDLFRQKRYDLVLMDVQMPGTDGLQATRLIRQYEQEQQRRSVPIIALTASVLDRDRQAARAAGMDGFASKPLEWGTLEAEIARLLGNPSPAALSDNATGGGDKPLVNWAAARQRWGDQQSLDKALQRFASQAAAHFSSLQAALKNDDSSALLLAHKLRGGAANLGLESLAANLTELEQQLHRGLPATLDKLQGILHALSETLAARPEAPTASTGQSSIGPAQRPQLLELVSLLRRGDPDNHLLSSLLPLLPASEREALSTAIDDFDFDRAVTLLERLISQLPAGDAHAD